MRSMETPSAAAAASICVLSPSGSRSVIRALGSSPGARLVRRPPDLVDEDELGLAPASRTSTCPC